MAQGKRDPKPKQGDDLRRSLERIAGRYDPADVDPAAVERYLSGPLDHVEVGRLARSSSVLKRQTARLRAAAMLTALDSRKAS